MLKIDGWVQLRNLTLVSHHHPFSHLQYHSLLEKNDHAWSVSETGIVTEFRSSKWAGENHSDKELLEPQPHLALFNVLLFGLHDVRNRSYHIRSLTWGWFRCHLLIQIGG